MSMTDIGDVTGDGRDDFAISAPISNAFQAMKGKVWAFSGANGQRLWMREGDQSAEAFGWSLASAGDADGDGIGDLAIGSPAWDDGLTMSVGRVVVVSGSSGGTIWQWHETEGGAQVGIALAGMQDRDGDGRDELAVGAAERSMVVILGSATHGEIDRILGQSSSEFGASLARMRDVTGDGMDDLIVGAPRHNAGTAQGGGAFVCSGANGNILLPMRGEPNSHFGWSVAAADDVDGDGRDDVLVGAIYHRIDGVAVGRAELCSSATGHVIRRVNGDSTQRYFGSSVAGLDDLNGDGIGEILIGQEGGMNRPGAGYVFSGEAHAAGEMRVADFQPATTLAARTILADLDGDDAAEMISIDEANDRVEVRGNNGSGGYHNPVYLNVGRGPSDAICIDLDRDGDRDLVVALRKDSALAVYTNAYGVLLRSGVIKVNRQPVSVVAADFNGDQRIDLAVAGRRNRDLLILRQTAVSWTYLHKRFVEKRLIPLADEPTRVMVANLNDNSRPDILVVSAAAGRSTGFIDVISGQPAPPVFTTMGSGGSGPIVDCAVGDTDGDGLSDIAVCDGISPAVMLHRGLGNGAFGTAQSIAGSGQAVRSVCAVDLNHDGVDDLACGAPDASAITLMIMSQVGGPPAMFTYPTVNNPRWLMRGDVDGDGDADVSAINHQGAMTQLQNLILDP